MRKQDMTVVSALVEAICIILGFVYIGLQIFYGITFHIKAYTFILNVLTMILVYAGLSMLSMYPERVNRIEPERCVGNVRTYSLWMVRAVKLIFIVGLLVPSVCDAAGFEILSSYSLIVIGTIILVSVYCEYKILSELRNQ